METGNLIYSALSNVMAEIGSIGKNSRNASQNYNFRGVDDVYNELHAVLSKHKVFSVPDVLEERSEERTTKQGSVLIYRVLKIQYTFYTTDGSNVVAVVIGEAMDSGDKASNKAMSVAHKYAMLQLFCIPTNDPKDPEDDSPEPTPKATPMVASKPVPAKPQIQQSSAAPFSAFGIIENVDIAEGESAKGPWKKYGVKIDNAFYSTFSASIGELATMNIGQKANVIYTTNGKYKTITDLQIAEPVQTAVPEYQAGEELPF